jgi:hypothetical protein
LNVVYTINEEITSALLAYVLNKYGDTLCVSFDTDFNNQLAGRRLPGKYLTTVELPSPLKAGKYEFANIGIGVMNIEPIDFNPDCLAFEVEEKSFDGSL